MAQGEHTAIFDVDAEKLYRAVTDYERYPQFVDGMKNVMVDRSNGKVIAHYELSMMGKDMSYTLNLKESPEMGNVSWTLAKSEFFKINNGDWKIESLGPGKCKARYFSEVEFTFPVPGFVLKPIVKGALPKMMDGFYQRAKQLPDAEVKPEVKAESSPAPEEAPVVEVKSEPIVEKAEPKLESPKREESRAQSEKIDFEKERHATMNEANDSGVFSWAKKIMTVGVGTFFLTEEALRSLVSEFKIPKEMVGNLLDGAKSVRAEFMQSVVTEMMSKISDKMDPAAVLAEFLKKNEVTFEVKIKVKEKSSEES